MSKVLYINSKRLNLFYKKFNIKDEKSKINNVNIPKLKHVLDSVDWRYISKGIICNFHGDFILKIFYIQKNKV